MGPDHSREGYFVVFGGNDMFAPLSVMAGASATPLFHPAFDKIKDTDSLSIVIVSPPLIALMNDQLSSLGDEGSPHHPLSLHLKVKLMTSLA